VVQTAAKPEFFTEQKIRPIKGINTARQALHQKQIRDLRPPAAASAASRGVLNPSFPHSLDHARASTVAISLRSSMKFCKSIPYLINSF
jgi:hypothetical protein